MKIASRDLQNRIGRTASNMIALSSEMITIYLSTRNLHWTSQLLITFLLMPHMLIMEAGYFKALHKEIISWEGLEAVQRNSFFRSCVPIVLLSPNIYLCSGGIIVGFAAKTLDVTLDSCTGLRSSAFYGRTNVRPRLVDLMVVFTLVDYIAINHSKGRQRLSLGRRFRFNVFVFCLSIHSLIFGDSWAPIIILGPSVLYIRRDWQQQADPSLLGSLCFLITVLVTFPLVFSGALLYMLVIAWPGCFVMLVRKLRCFGSSSVAPL